MELRYHSKKDFLIVGLILLGITYFYRAGLFFSNFNLDEVILTLSSQNIMVQDYAFFKPLSQNSSFFDIWQANRTYGSIDPGFFTLILHYWSLISTKTLWLRLLPFSFFLGSLIILIKIATPVKGKLYYGLFPLFLVFRDQLIMDHAYTIRPYAMEMMGTFFLFSFLLNFKALWKKESIIYMLVLSFFLGSRYFFWINTVCAIFSFLWVERNLNFKVMLKLFFVPFIVGIILLAFTYSYQIKTLDLRYLNVNYDPMNPWLLEVFKNINFRLFLSFPIYLLFFKKKHLNNKEKKILIFLFLSFCSYVLLSLLKISPFRMNQRFTIGFHVMAIVSCTLFLKEAFIVIFTHKKKMALFLNIIGLSFSLHSYFLFQQLSDIIPIVKKIKNDIPAQEKVYCDVVSCSMIRFLKDFTGYKMDWDKMPSFELISEQRVVHSDFKDKSFILVIAPVGNLGKLSSRMSKEAGWEIEKGYYYQRLYRKY